jgi:septin family protein
MALFKKKNEGYVDLSEKLRKRQEKIKSFKENNLQDEEVEEKAVETSSNTGNGFFGGFFGGGSSSNSVQNESGAADADEKRRRLAKRLGEMTSRMEDMEKEIYQLKQKLEVLEKKQRLGY